jgi:hypothetical protein
VDFSGPLCSSAGALIALGFLHRRGEEAAMPSHGRIHSALVRIRWM